MITFALTSCGRPDLLERTLDSFFENNMFPIKRYKIIDDSTHPELFEDLVKKYPQIEWTFNTERLGQSASIDILYDDIDTPIIFHCEDDWEFLQGGFIEESLHFMLHDDRIIQCWLRGPHDTNGHPVTIGEEYDILNYGYQGIWHGFSFNPGVKRLEDYKLINSYSGIGREEDIGKIYKDLGFYAISLKDRYVEHIGWGRHVSES